MDNPTDVGSKTPIFLALSGGVDSAVAATLLHAKHPNLICVFMDCGGNQMDGCSPQNDIQDAIKVCSLLNIPFEVWDFSKQFEENVLREFYFEYKKFNTPNPDV